LKIINIHRRIIYQKENLIAEIFNSLATKNDRIWPIGKWPKMKFKDGVKVDSVGGHGPIRYSINKYVVGKYIEFKFLSPTGFNGIHKFEILEIDSNKTELKHTIDMNISLVTFINWFFIVRPLHDALLEDALDRVENVFLEKKKSSKWNLWVVFLRKVLSGK